MSDGRYWNCRWEPHGTGFRAWVASRPNLQATGSTWQETLDELAAEICHASGDGEPNFTFDPPEPIEGSDARWAHPGWVALGVGGCVPLEAVGDEMFTRGHCPHCLDPWGDRTEQPLRAAGPGEGDLCWPFGYGMARYLPIMMSERLLSLFSAAELSGFRLQPMAPAPRTRKRYVECIPRTYVAPIVPRGWTVSGSRCPTCERESFISTSEPKIDFGNNQIHDWCCTADIPEDSEHALALGSLRSWQLLLPLGRARELCRHRFAAGARAGRIGAVPPDMVQRNPELPVSRAARKPAQPGGS